LYKQKLALRYKTKSYKKIKFLERLNYRESLRRVLGQGKKISRHDQEKKKSREFVQKIFSKKYKKILITQAFWRICLKNGHFFFAKEPMGHELKLIIFFSFKRAK